MKFITPLILVVLSLGAIFYYIKPEYDTITQIKQNISSFDSAIAEAKLVGQKRDDLLAKQNSFSQSNLDRLNKLLPDSVDDIRFIIEVNSLAAKQGVNIGDIHIISGATGGTQAGQSGQIKNTAVYGTDSISFSVSMTYDQFLNFLSDIENNLRITDVGSLSLKPSDQSAVYDYSLTLNTYWLK